VGGAVVARGGQGGHEVATGAGQAVQVLPRMPKHGVNARVKNGPALAGHGAEAVRDEMAQTITTLPEQLRRSLTWDQGAEMAQHAHLRIDAGLQVFFCDPHSPWQRGTNENTNGLLRQYFPKAPT
jgi:IS30 family transposase